MTSEEIKNSVTMEEVLSRYGIKVKRGMCSCPFHGKDRHPSMKVYKDGYKCFTCNEAGDVFKFVQNYEHCDFRTAFSILGGTYEHANNEKVRVCNTLKREREESSKQLQKQAERSFFVTLTWTIELCREFIKQFDFNTEEHMTASFYLPLLEEYYEQKYIRREEVKELDVYRMCRTVRQKFDL